MWLYRGCHKRAFVPWPILVKMFSFSVLVKKNLFKIINLQEKYQKRVDKLYASSIVSF